MSLYYGSVDSVALVATTAKSLMELGTPAGSEINIKEWWIQFDGVTSTAVPVRVELARFSSGVTTATTLALSKFTAASPTAGTTFKHSTTVEGAGTASDVINFRIPPTSGYHYVAPLGQELLLAPSAFWRMRVTAAANVNATFGVVVEE